MLAIPAIDILGAKAVRLYKGEKQSAKIYSDNPQDVARVFKAAGVKLIHVVDLDAAFGDKDNLETIKKIVGLGIDIEVGGGIRSIEKAEKLIELGVKTIIIGTKASDKNFLRQLTKQFPRQVGVGVDIFQGKVMQKGWQEKTDFGLVDFVKYLCDNGVDYIIYTDINRDGTLQGFDIESAKVLKKIGNIKFVVSGGVGSVNDLTRIKTELPFMHGVIIGKAYYEKKIDLTTAIKILT